MKKFAVLLWALCIYPGSALDLLQTPGQEKDFHPVMPAGELIPFSQAVHSGESCCFIRNPDRRKYLSVGLAEFAPEENAVYRFSMRASGREGLEIAAFLSEFDGENFYTDRNLLRTTLFLNVNGVTEFQKEFAVSPGTKKAIPCITFFSRHGTMSAGVIALLEKLQIEKVSEMKRAPEKIRARNFADNLDFNRFPVGDFTLMHKGNGPGAAQGADVIAEIVELPGDGNALHIVRKKGDYVYPYLQPEKFPIDPQYHFVKVSFDAKGRGAFRTGIWWKRRHMEWDYENAPLCRLTDQWQHFVVYRPCLAPDVEAMTFSVNSSDEGEYFIRNLHVHLE